MVYGLIARGLGKTLGKGFLRNLGGKAAVKDIAQEALISGGLNFGLQTGTQLLAGQPVTLGSNLLYAGADSLASGGALAGVRGARPRRMRRVEVTDPKTGAKTMVKERVRSKLETPVNVGASVLSGIPVALMQGGGEQVQQNAQASQVAQQNLQRSLVNGMPLAGAYMPGTMMQNVGAPSSSALYQQMLNDMNAGVANDPSFQANAMAIMGLQ